MTQNKKTLFGDSFNDSVADKQNMNITNKDNQEKKGLNIGGFQDTGLNKINISYIKDLDFLKDTLKIDLLLPFSFQGKLVKFVILRKLYINDLSYLKKNLQRMDLNNQRNLLNVYKFFELLFSSSLEGFEYEDGTAVDKNIMNRLIGLVPVNNIMRLLIAIFLLNRERPHISANYTCDSCKTLNSFDIDPESNEAIKVEGDFHGLMENLFDFMLEDYEIFDDEFREDGFYFQLTKPYSIMYGDDEIVIEKLFFSYPNLSLYGSNLSNPRKKDDFELWTLFDSIRSVNDKSDIETSEIKKSVGMVNFFKRFSTKDFKALNSKMFNDGLSFEHSFTCMNCGYINKTDLDLTNFFVFLTG